MENKRGNEIFLGVIGVATLLVAIIGATFAFFSANAQSGEQAITATGASLKLGYDDNTTLLKSHLIPSTKEIAHYSTTTAHYGDDVNKICIDDYGNEICSYYTFNVGNPSFTTKQDLYGTLTPVTNEMTNLMFLIMDETGAIVVQPKAITGTEAIALPELTQKLETTDENEATTLGESFDDEKPSTYPKRCTYDGSSCTTTNVRTYTLVLWINETGVDQTVEDSGMSFAGGITFTSGNSTQGVTGVISAAKNYTIPSASSSSASE